MLTPSCVVYSHSCVSREHWQTGFILVLCALSYWESIHLKALVGFLSDNNCTFWVTLLQLHVCCLVKKTVFSPKKVLMLNTEGNAAFSLWILSTHPLTYFVCGRHKWLMTSCIEVACQQLWCKSRSAAARNPVASVKRLCTLPEPLCMKHILQRLSIRPNTRHIALENIYKSLPAVTVIAGPNPVHCRCVWCASKTHKPTHIPERVSRPCLHKTIMSEIFLCSLNTWSLQFGEMAAWLSVLEACPDTVLSSRLPTVSAHTLQLCEPTVLQSSLGWDRHINWNPPPSLFSPVLHELSSSCKGSEAEKNCVLSTTGSRQNNGNTSQKRISALKWVTVSLCNFGLAATVDTSGNWNAKM